MTNQEIANKVVCPRCGKEWKDHEQRINSLPSRANTVCRLVYLYQLNEFVMRIDGNDLYWESDGKSCTYYSPSKTIRLPYLPFTITLEDLAKYLILL